jgi:hypothetical protein
MTKPIARDPIYRNRPFGDCGHRLRPHACFRPIAAGSECQLLGIQIGGAFRSQFAGCFFELHPHRLTFSVCP